MKYLLCLLLAGCSGANFTGIDAGSDAGAPDAKPPTPTCLTPCEATCPLHAAACATACELGQPFTCPVGTPLPDGGVDGPITPPDAAVESGSLDADASDGGGSVDSPVESEADTSCNIAHQNGFGGTYESCDPLGSYTLADALAACASAGGMGCWNMGCPNIGNDFEVCGAMGSAYIVLVFQGPDQGQTATVIVGGCQCPSGGTPNWN